MTPGFKICSDIDMEHLSKDFLSDAEFPSEVPDISWRGSDGGVLGEICVSVSQLSLNHADTLLQIGNGLSLPFKFPIKFLKRPFFCLPNYRFQQFAHFCLYYVHVKFS